MKTNAELAREVERRLRMETDITEEELSFSKILEDIDDSFSGESYDDAIPSSLFDEFVENFVSSYLQELR